MEEKRIKFSIEYDPYNFVFRTFGNKWKPFIIQAMKFDQRCRFGMMVKQLPISEKVLAANLRELERDGLVYKIVYPEVPPRVEYGLTKQGKEVSRLLDGLYDWGWREMKRRGLPIDPLVEMWHGYRERDEKLMYEPYSKKRSNDK